MNVSCDWGAHFAAAGGLLLLIGVGGGPALALMMAAKERGCDTIPGNGNQLLREQCWARVSKRRKIIPNSETFLYRKRLQFYPNLVKTGR
jgi:hypothetical protein